MKMTPNQEAKALRDMVLKQHVAKPAPISTVPAVTAAVQEAKSKREQKRLEKEADRLLQRSPELNAATLRAGALRSIWLDLAVSMGRHRGQWAQWGVFHDRAPKRKGCNVRRSDPRYTGLVWDPAEARRQATSEAAARVKAAQAQAEAEAARVTAEAAAYVAQRDAA